MQKAIRNLLIISILFNFYCIELFALKPKQKAKIQLGIDVLEEQGFKPLKNKRVGLLTHPAGVNRYGKSTVDILHQAPTVKLIALFGPEHGIYGNERAEVPVLDKIDKKTGLPVYSLYGKYRKPTKEMLSKIDTLVIDLQDIGTRSYTYISCMKLAIEACFENNKEVIVLDRPNPLGGKKVCGPMLEKEWKSYVGSFEMPYVHGLTAGEIARICKEVSGWLNVDKRTLKRGRLTVIPMRGWKRELLWPETGLNWVPTSPYIPTFSAVIGYAMTGLGAQIGGFRHGIGTNHPFRLLTFKEIPAPQIKKALEEMNIDGLDYKLISFKNSKDKLEEGIYLNIKDYNKLELTDISFYMMQLACRFSKNNPFKKASKNEGDLFNKHVGSAEFFNELIKNGSQAKADEYNMQAKSNSREFQKWSKRFMIYS